MTRNRWIDWMDSGWHKMTLDFLRQPGWTEVDENVSIPTIGRYLNGRCIAEEELRQLFIGINTEISRESEERIRLTHLWTSCRGRTHLLERWELFRIAAQQGHRTAPEGHYDSYLLQRTQFAHDRCHDRVRYCAIDVIIQMTTVRRQGEELCVMMSYHSVQKFKHRTYVTRAMDDWIT